MMVWKLRVDTGIEWREYPSIAPGDYSASCRFAKNYWDPAYRRWVCLLLFDVLTYDLQTVIATVPCFLALGHGEKPYASRRGKYLKEWVRANGGPPARSDRLSPRVFERRMARVEVGDTDPKRSPVPYSVVRRIISWERGAVPARSASKSRHQRRQANVHLITA